MELGVGQVRIRFTELGAPLDECLMKCNSRIIRPAHQANISRFGGAGELPTIRWHYVTKHTQSIPATNSNQPMIPNGPLTLRSICNGFAIRLPTSSVPDNVHGRRLKYSTTIDTSLREGLLPELMSDGLTLDNAVSYKLNSRFRVSTSVSPFQASPRFIIH